MSDGRYDPKLIEPKWQELWARERTWEVSNEEAGPSGRQATPEKSYVLEMLPYPSGEPHIGHLKNYALGDAIAHFHRRTGRHVLHPMGYDAFGLPAENAAIRTGEPPREVTRRNIARIRQQLKRQRLLAAHTIYECPSCGERSLGEQRCSTCRLFCRALGLGGSCPDCDSPILLADLLGTEVATPA